MLVSPQSMTRARKRLADSFLIACALLWGASLLPVPEIAAQSSGASKMPVFEVDTAWPRLPNNWTLGNVSKIVADRHDNIWLMHRPRTVPAGKTSAPPVVELDPNGKFVQAWGGEGTGYDWPDAEHNIFVDYKDNVWIS